MMSRGIGLKSLSLSSGMHAKATGTNVIHVDICKALAHIGKKMLTLPKDISGIVPHRLLISKFL